MAKEQDPYGDFRTEPSEDTLSQLTTLAQRQIALEETVAQFKDQLKQAEGELAQVQEHDIPDLMDNLGVTLYKLKTGQVIEIKETLRFSVPKDRKDEAYDWLIENDLGGGIKRHVGVDFAVDEAREAEQLAALLRKKKLPTQVDRKVEPATLGSILNAEMAAGREVPLELFGAWRQRKAKVKSTKRR